MLIDTHCHLQFRAFDKNRDEVIKRAQEAGVTMIIPGTKKSTSEGGIKIAEKYEKVWAAVGLHPFHLFKNEIEEEGITTSPEDFDAEMFRKFMAHPKVVAVGECGLDYYHLEKQADIRSVKQKQKEAFRAHLDLAEEFNLPVINHCRDAYDDQCAILKEYVRAGKLKRRGVMHCFIGTEVEAKMFLDLGFLISFTGIVTFPPRKDAAHDLVDVVRMVPLDKIMLDTDAPYLAPVPRRGEQNEPIFVKYIAEKIAEIKNVSFNEVAKQTTENARKLFAIG